MMVLCGSLENAEGDLKKKMVGCFVKRGWVRILETHRQILVAISISRGDASSLQLRVHYTGKNNLLLLRVYRP